MIEFLLFATTTVAIWSVLGLSLNLQFGLTGLVNFGQVLPFAVGAFGAAIAAAHGLPVWAGAVLGIVAAPLMGLLVLWPVGRLAQDYWALVTLGAGEIFRLVMTNVPVIAGGVDGTMVSRLPDRLTAMLVSLALLAVSILVCARVGASPFGRLLRVIREDETLAATLGRSPRSFQARVTIVSWTMAGAAGVLFGHFVGYVAPSSFGVVETFIVWTAMVLGGPGSIRGVILGTAIVHLLGVSTRFIAQWSGIAPDVVANLRLALFGLILVLMFIYRPQGLIPERLVKTNAVDP